MTSITIDKFCPPGYELLNMNEKVSSLSESLVVKGKSISTGIPLSLKLIWNQNNQLSFLMREVALRDYEVNRYLEQVSTEDPLVFRIIETMNFVNELGVSINCTVMEDTQNYITLSQYLTSKKNHRLDLSSFLALACNMCAVLGHVHSANVIHLGLSLNSFMVNPETLQVRLKDFGCATISSLYNSYIPNTSKENSKSLQYISPEETRMTKQHLSYLSDYYSLGIIFYQMLAGKTPFCDDEGDDLLSNHANQNPPMLKEFDAVVPPAIENIVQKLLCKDASSRYKSTIGIIHDLKFCDTSLSQSSEIPTSFNPGDKDVRSRLVFPHTVIGREKVLSKVEKQLKVIIEREQPRLFIVRDEWGSGIMDIVHELQTRYSDSCRFINVRLYTNEENIPYRAWISVMKYLVVQLLREPMEADEFRDKIAKVTEGFDHLIEEINILTGRKTSDKWTAEDTVLDFVECIKKFMELFCTKDNKLCIFVENVENMDDSSLDVLDALIRSSLSLMVICGSKALETSHKFEIRIENIRNTKEIAERIKILNIDPVNEVVVNQFVSQLLLRDKEETKTLSKLITQSTNGSCVAVKESLYDLLSHGKLFFNNETGLWEWDGYAIEMWFAQNPGPVLSRTMHASSTTMKQLLKFAAVMNEFTYEQLVAVSGEKREIVLSMITDWVSKGWVAMHDYERKFVFSDPRVFSSACSLVQDDETSTIHFKVGLSLLVEAKKHGEFSKHIYLIAGHLNYGRYENIEDMELVKGIVNANLECARQSYQKSSFLAAEAYINNAVRILSLYSTEESLSELHLDMRMLHARTQNALGNHREALMSFEELFAKSEDKQHKLRIGYHILECCNNSATLYQYGYQFLFKLLKITNYLNISPDDDDKKLEAWIKNKRDLVQSILDENEDLEEAVINRRFQNLKEDSIVNSLEVSALGEEKEKEYLMKVISTAIPLVFLASKVDKWSITAFGLYCGDLVLHNRVYYHSGACVSFFGWVWATFVEDTKRGIDLSLLGLKLAEQTQANQSLALCHFFCSQIAVWRNVPHTTVLKHFDEAYKYAQRISSVTLTTLIGIHDSLFRLLSGTDLSEFLQRFLRLTTYAEKMKIDFIADCASAMLPMIQYLKGESTITSARFKTPGFRDGPYGGFLVKLFKALSYYFTGQLADAKKLVYDNEKHRSDFLGFHVEYVYPVISAMILSAAFHSSNNDDEKADILKHMKDVGHFSEHYHGKSKGFLAPVYSFVQAEIATCTRPNPLDSIKLFQQCLKFAKTSGFSLLQTFSLMRLVELYKEHGIGDNVISLFVTEAIELWSQIGSTTMTSNIRHKYNEYLHNQVTSSSTKDSDLVRKKSKAIAKSGLSQGSSHFLRRGSVVSVKAYNQSRLTRFKSEMLSIMKIIVNKSKAQRCCLITKGDDSSYMFDAEIFDTSAQVKHRQIPLVQCEKELCLTFVRKAIDSSQSIIVKDNSSLNYDKYAKSNGVNCIICVQILDENEQIGFVYLENKNSALNEQTVALVSAIIELAIQNSKINSSMKTATSTYEKFLPKEFLSYLGISDAESLESSTSKQFSLMFADFQPLVNSVDKMEVTETFSYLNGILGKVAAPINSNQGFIHQFLGDTLTALFSGPTDNVLKAAVQVVSALKDVQQERKTFMTRRRPEIRMGIHYGTMKLGTIKLSENRMDTSFFAAGAPIARQLELFAKTFNTSIIVTNDVVDRLTSLKDSDQSQDLGYCCLGKFFLKDLGVTHELYQVYDKKWDAFLYSDERKKQFLKGLEMFQQRKFVAAMTTFSKLHKLNDNDLISQFYSKVSKMYQQVQPPQTWDGCVLVDRDCKPNPIGSKSNSFYLQTGISAYHHFGDEQLLSNGKDKEEEIKLLNESLNQKSITIRDMKEILSVKEQEINRLQEITEVLMKEKKQEVEKLKHTIDILRQKGGDYLDKSKGNGKWSSNESGGILSKCFPCISPKSSRVLPASEPDPIPLKANVSRSSSSSRQHSGRRL